MKILAKTKDLSHEEWLKYRTQGIGGSDVSILAGINPFHYHCRKASKEISGGTLLWTIRERSVVSKHPRDCKGLWERKEQYN